MKKLSFSIYAAALQAWLASTAPSAAFAEAPTQGGADPCEGHHHAPPPEAYDACDAKAEGDACTVSFDERTIDGTCAADPETDGALFCMPDHPPPPPSGEPRPGAQR